MAGLPKATPIFIIIDGTDFYEIPELRDDIKEAVEEINKLISSKSVEAMVKILITSPTQSFNLIDYFATNEIINVPEDMDDTMIKFSETKLKLQFDSRVEDLKCSLSRKGYM